MTNRDMAEPYDARLEGRGFFAAGTEGEKPSAVEGDSPTTGTVEGPLAPQAQPGGVEAEFESEMRPKERDPRQSDGLAEFKQMERNAEAGRE